MGPLNYSPLHCGTNNTWHLAASVFHGNDTTTHCTLGACFSLTVLLWPSSLLPGLDHYVLYEPANAAGQLYCWPLYLSPATLQHLCIMVTIMLHPVPSEQDSPILLRCPTMASVPSMLLVNLTHALLTSWSTILPMLLTFTSSELGTLWCPGTTLIHNVVSECMPPHTTQFSHCVSAAWSISAAWQTDLCMLQNYLSPILPYKL